MSAAADSVHYWPVIAVVDGHHPTAVWHVDTDPEAKRGYFTGAWLVGESEQQNDTGRTNDELSWAGKSLNSQALEPLVRGVAVVATESGRAALQAAQVQCEIVDVAATEQAVADQIEQYRQAVREENRRRRELKSDAVQTTSEEDLTQLRLPSLPKRIELSPLTATPGGVEASKEALAWANGVARFVAEWNDVDRVRRQRAKGFLTRQWGVAPLTPPLVTEKMSTLEV